MRVEAVNSFLSSGPVLYEPIVAPVVVGPNGQNTHRPTGVKAVQAPPLRYVDTIARATSEPSFRVCTSATESMISPAEITTLLAIIAQQSRRTDCVLPDFSGLLKV